MENNLPEVCFRCHRLKASTLGRWVKVAGRAHDRHWVCNRCLGKPIINSVSRRSPIELEARRAVLATGYRFNEEFELGPFRYDLAIPALRLLLELDSRRWHRHPSRIARDRKKDQLAKVEGWTLARVSTKQAESVSFSVRQAVLRREAELSHDLDP